MTVAGPLPVNAPKRVPLSQIAKELREQRESMLRADADPKRPPFRTQRHFAASGRESYNINDAKPMFVERAVVLLCDRFGFRQCGQTAVGLDEILATVRRGWRVWLYVAWDNWGGFDITAITSAGDPVVRELADYFDSIKDDAVLAEYFESPRNT